MVMTIILPLQKATCGEARSHHCEFIDRSHLHQMPKKSIKFCISPYNNWQTRFNKDKTAFGWAAARQGMTFCDKRGNGGWTNPHLRVQQAAGLRTKVSSKESEQTECPALPPPTRKLVFIFGFLYLAF